jgi:hypothetical protein
VFGSSEPVIHFDPSQVDTEFVATPEQASA